jgi:hypothetical protein
MTIPSSIGACIFIPGALILSSPFNRGSCCIPKQKAKDDGRRKKEEERIRNNGGIRQILLGPNAILNHHAHL